MTKLIYKNKFKARNVLLLAISTLETQNLSTKYYSFISNQLRSEAGHYGGVGQLLGEGHPDA
jgi:hypothetical protein